MSDFVVSARKYRPQRFADVLGQGHVTRTLKNALSRNQLAHAFLFTGPRGVGKTTCARILAKVINCENALTAEDKEPCNVCDSCRMFNEQASFNIMELDAASNNSVDAIRNLIEQVRYLPQQGKYKVFIIDEVHMLSAQAFNAFLKTLEEPPAHAIFILATTERHKIIPTILSRCQVYDFRRIKNDEIVKQLKEVAKDQSIRAEDDALHIIAQKSDGSMRDALSIFDRIASFTDRQVTYTETINNLNVLDYEYYFNLVYAMLREDATAVMNMLQEIYTNGFEGSLILEGLAEHLRNLFVSKDQAATQLLEGSPELKERYYQQAQLVSTSFILNALAITNACDVQYERARNKRLHIELAMVRMAYLNRIQEMDSITTESKEKKNPESLIKEFPKEEILVHPGQSVFDQPFETQAPDIRVPEKKLSASASLATPKIKSLKEIHKRAEEQLQALSGTAIEFRIENFQNAWNKYAETIELPTLKSVLNQAELVLENTKLIIKVGSNHSKSIIQLEQALLEKLRQAVSDKRLEIAVVIDPEKAKWIEENQPKRPASNKEKYEQMKQINPAIEEMIKLFKLKIDHGQ